MTLFHTSLALRPVMELLKYAVCDTCESPVRTHEISPATHPSHTHTHTHTHGFIHTGHQHHRGQGRGAQSGLRCKTAPACFNFHLPHQDPLRPEAQEAPPLHLPPLQSPPPCCPAMDPFQKTRHDKPSFRIGNEENENVKATHKEKTPTFHPSPTHRLTSLPKTFGSISRHLHTQKCIQPRNTLRCAYAFFFN